MASWIATHNPHTLGGVPHHIYFKKPPKNVPSAGDSVFIYETESPEEGHTEAGRGAIVFLAKASGKVVQNPHANRDKWPLKMDCYDHSELSIPIEDARELVKQPFYRRTLARISEEECQKLKAAGKRH